MNKDNYKFWKIFDLEITLSARISFVGNIKLINRSDLDEYRFHI